MQQVRYVRHELVGIQRFGSKRLLARECEQPGCKLRRTIGCVHRCVEHGGDIAVAFRHAFSRKCDGRHDHGQHVVEVVRHTPGQLADCFHLVDLTKLRLCRAAGG